MTVKSTEKADFLKTFAVLEKDIMNDLSSYNLPADGKEWLKKMVNYTVPHGKMNRGMTVLSSYKALSKKDLTESDIFKCNTLGWCIELLQAFFLVSDDIMDSSITRRGQPCWYKNEQVGLVAINDAFLLESMIYKVLKKYFKKDTYYVELLEMFHEVTYQTELGQLMDLITAPEDKVDLEKFTIKKHAYIVEYKTAYYSFYLPIALAMKMMGITDEKAYKQAKNVLLPLGEYFQVQDDYLDCYGDPAVIGKIGTDIQDNKCSWLINQALSLASVEERRLLDENYGRKDAKMEAIVKKVFVDLKIKDVYHEYEERSYARIRGLIEEVDEEVLPREMFLTFMNRIYKRNT